MPFARLRELVHTLRFRLVLWVTIVVFVLVVLSMIAIGQVVRRSLVFEFDNLLGKNFNDLRLLLKDQPIQPQLFERLEELVADKEGIGFVEIFDPRGKEIWRSAQAPLLPPVSPYLRRHHYDDHGTVRFIEGRDPYSGWLLRLGVSRARLDEDMVLVNRIAILSSLFILVLTPAAGFVVASRATRPLKWIITTTAELQPERLSERLPVRATGDELDQLCITINGMLDRIASYIQRHRDFIGRAAHELRSPLAAIRSSVEVALNRPRSNEEYAEALENVTEECGRLGNLVDRLLLLGEGDAGQFSLTNQTTRLDNIVRESIDMFQGVAEVQDVPLTTGPLPEANVRGDESQLREVVRNLIDNALKFTASPGSVHVALEISPARKAILRVADQGIGISPDDLPHIFERFFRADRSRQRHAGRAGTGLGLSICDSIVQALQGEIRVESAPGQGTTFTVEFPLASP